MIRIDHTTVLGLIAGTLTTISFLPQLVKTWRSKSTHDISLGMFSLLCIGIFLWIIYGVAIRSLPVIAANGVTFVLALAIVILKLKHR